MEKKKIRGKISNNDNNKKRKKEKQYI